METRRESRNVTLEAFEWLWDETDKDAIFKQEVADYSRVDPMPTIETMNRNLHIPIGCIVRYILVKWAASGSLGLLEIGPRVVGQMAEFVNAAESTGTDQARLEAYRKVSRIVSWLNVPLSDPKWRPGQSEDPPTGA